MAVLVFLEHHGNELQKSSLGVLSKAATLGDPDVAGVVAGSGVRALASEAGKFEPHIMRSAPNSFTALPRKVSGVALPFIDCSIGRCVTFRYTLGYFASAHSLSAAE